MPPPKYNPPNKIYATEIESRRPKFKIHSGLGQARSAVRYTYGMLPRGGIIYELGEGNEWVEFEKLEPNWDCVLCDERITDHKCMILNNQANPEHRRVAHYTCIKFEFPDHKYAWQIPKALFDPFLTEEEKKKRH